MIAAHELRAVVALALLATAQAAPPGNDAFGTPSSLTAGTAATGTNLEATAEPGEPAHAAQPAAASVWWAFTAGVSGPVEIETVGSAIDTRLAVYTGGGLASLVLIAENDDINPATEQSRVAINAVAGTTYRVAVDGFAGATGAIRLFVHDASANANDDFADRTDLGSVTTFTTSGSNVGATAEPGEPLSLGQQPASTLWWTWTAPSSGDVTIDTTLPAPKLCPPSPRSQARPRRSKRRA